jgi:hypothetical protein
MAIGKGDVGDTIDALRRINDPPATQNKIMCRHRADS